MSETQVPLVPERKKSLPDFASKDGLLSWVAAIDHKLIGIMYIVTALVFFIIGGVEALIMRVQLGAPENSLLTPEIYNQIFTMHGTTMIFLVVVPLMLGFSVYLIPLMIGAKDMAFPRLNLLSFWLLAFGGIMLYFSFLAGGAPDAGWFAYTPLSDYPYSLSHGQDYWALGLLAVGIGTIATGINIITTVLTMAAPGMKITRMPMFVWTTFINSFLIILALPALNAALVMLEADRLFNATFFQASVGGAPILWQHYFWAFGHPEVYIMILPAWGMLAEVIPVFSRKPLFGFAVFAASSVAIAFLSFAVYAHHMFAVGLGHGFDAIFAISSEIIAVPTGIKIFNWIATMWGGKIRFTTSMLFAMAFLVLFTMGGVSGVTFAIAPTDWQTTDTYYVVAHMHYVLFGGTLFAVFAGTYYWFPKMSGRMLSEKWGKWHFWLTFIGFNTTFLVQHFLGLMGMPRRVFTYPDRPGWGILNLTSTIGAFILAAGILAFMWNVFVSLRHGQKAGNDPWDAWTLEWTTTSPPPPHNFSQLPVVRSRRPLWDLKHPDKPDWKLNESGNIRQDAQSMVWPAVVSKPEKVMGMKRLGMFTFIASEAVFFLLLIVAYVYYQLQVPNQAGPDARNVLEPLKTLIFSVCLFASSGTIWLAGRSARKNSIKAMSWWILATVILGAIFLAGQGWEYFTLLTDNVTISRNTFGTSFFTLTGFHGLHVFSGLIALSILTCMGFFGAFKRKKPVALEPISLYWHFVDVVWVVIYSIVYIPVLFQK
ncbi:MAG TPA: cytochrome c oxidase subunit I [Chloroflexia bacterium]|nr:cytochrome c oxidase subunit I [Chloroflexia bacterium]